MDARVHRRRRGVPAASTSIVLVALVALGVLACPRAAAGVQAHAAFMSDASGCAVCHTAAADDGLFSRSSAAVAGPVTDGPCVACHVLGLGPAAPIVYGGDIACYRTADGFGHNDTSRVTCLDCHAIHAPDGTNAALAGALLKPLDYQPAAVADADLPTASHDRAVSVWCTGCHPTWPVRIPPAPGARGGGWTSHPLVSAAGTSWRNCESCLSCHAAAGFPHYSAGADAGLVGAASAGQTRTGVPDRGWDGVCLACHRSGSGRAARGVGITY